MQAEIADLTQKLAIDQCNSREYQKLAERLEKENLELKTKLQSMIGFVTVISDDDSDNEPLSIQPQRNLESPVPVKKKRGRKPAKNRD